MVSQEYREAIVEVLEILRYSDKEITEKIPKSLLAFWERNQSDTYTPNINHEQKLQEMNLKPKTKAILTMLYINYVCNEEEKRQVQIFLKENEERYQNHLKEKYNENLLFKKKERIKQQSIKNETAMISYEPSWIEKIKRYIKNKWK